MDEYNDVWIKGKILNFLNTINECLNSTTFANDRTVYMNDIVTATRWLIRLHKGEPVANIYRDILSDKTNKYFTDYWRQGPWGEMEAEALEILQNKIRLRFGQEGE